MEESSIRLVLLIAGVFIIAGIYCHDVIKRKSRQEEKELNHSKETKKIEPRFSKDTAIIMPLSGELFDEKENLKADVRADSEAVEQPVNNEIPEAKQALVIQLAVLPKQGECILGVELLDAFTHLDLEFGDMGIFHRYERLEDVQVQSFHIANLHEPGIFPVGSMDEFESTGLVLFFQASALIDASAAFDSMLITARELSQTFNATLAGEDMQELTLDKIESIQAQIIELSRS